MSIQLHRPEREGAVNALSMAQISDEPHRQTVLDDAAHSMVEAAHKAGVSKSGTVTNKMHYGDSRRRAYCGVRSGSMLITDSWERFTQHTNPCEKCKNIAA